MFFKVPAEIDSCLATTNVHVRLILEPPCLFYCSLVHCALPVTPDWFGGECQ